MKELTTERTPSTFDYLAGGILANGLVYFWQVILAYMPDAAALSVVAYVLAGFAPSWFICRRTSKQHLLVGAKAAVAAWVITLFMLFSLASELSLTFVSVLLVCYLIGSLAASYLSLKKQIREKAEGESLPKAEYP